MAKPTTIKEFVETLNESEKKFYTLFKSFIQEVFPQIQEKLFANFPSFFLPSEVKRSFHETPQIHLAFFKDHVNVFALGIAKHKEKLSIYKVTDKNTLQIYFDKPILKDVLLDIIKDSFFYVKLVTRPKRKLILKRGISATHYYEYVNEVGCDVWEDLKKIPSLGEEPIACWLPSHLIRKGTSIYVQGTEVELDYSGPLPEGYDYFELPEATFLMIQGPSYDDDHYEEAIEQVTHFIDTYDPSLMGYQWDKMQPRYQLEPKGTRGYIEFIGVKKK